ncbi:aryl-alcohol dehydrogenase-like predicted oxidoreductase [Kitasatospora gansuensis]|uniref:Aryl-alcohol dehydrogenase-like predicted oxidoreductase n=1 Tax=Kitasatospora gansuensis TaxID=258050 RepID=A0A7W7SB71_9ACTN|nr:aldo/keto reductase [Kitasatospora gansuensis]MBB4947284.1 aryl-alcohol dehydrogenase-like predicted oxidoreductase [Kitasatospora gansuensis]
MQYRTIGTDPKTRCEVSALSLGAMLFGTRTDEATAFAVLDRYVEAGGTFIDTSNNYAYWIDDSRGGASEELLGRWRRSRGITDQVVIATKLGARPKAAGTGYVENREGLSAQAIRAEAEGSRQRLGVEKLDLLYAHVEDPTVPLAETVEGFGALVNEGTVGLLGVSNHWSWRVERARNLAARAGLPGYEVLQYSHSYFRRRADLPGALTADGDQGVVNGDLLSYVREDPALTLVAYSPLLGGGYTRPDKPLGPAFDHAGTRARRTVLDEVAAETGATHNQVVLAWLLGGEIPVIPLVGASSVAQLDESLAALDLELSAEQRDRLDSAY